MHVYYITRCIYTLYIVCTVRWRWIIYKGWPEPYIYTRYMTVYLVISLPKNKNGVYTPYIYGPGQP